MIWPRPVATVMVGGATGALRCVASPDVAMAVNKGVDLQLARFHSLRSLPHHHNALLALKFERPTSKRYTSINFPSGPAVSSAPINGMAWVPSWTQTTLLQKVRAGQLQNSSA